MDRPGDEAVDRHRLVDGGVERDADDATDRRRAGGSLTARRPPAIAASASARVGWASVPPGRARRQRPARDAEPERRVERLAVDPGREEARVERVAGTGRVDGVDGDRGDPASGCRPVPIAERAVGAALRPRPSAGRRRTSTRARPPRAATSASPVRREASTALGSRTSASAAASGEPAVPGSRGVPVGVEAGRRAGGVGGPEQPGELGGEARLEEVAAGMDVPGPARGVPAARPRRARPRWSRWRSGSPGPSRCRGSPTRRWAGRAPPGRRTRRRRGRRAPRA